MDGVLTLTSGRLTTIVDSDAAGHFVDDQLVPGLGQRTRKHKKLEEPRPVETAGNKKVFPAVTGTILGHVFDQAGQPVAGRT